MKKIAPEIPAHPYASFIADIEKPARYLGGERAQVKKSWDDVDTTFCLAFPDIYDVGMSHYGLKILYHVVNLEEDLAAERCFTPWPDFGEKLREHEIPLYSLESHTPLREFDVLGFTIQSEMTLTNLLYTLELANLPLRSRDRPDDAPIVVAGGAGAFSPEVLGEVVDAVTLGDGEEIVVPLLRLVAERRRGGQKI